MQRVIRWFGGRTNTRWQMRLIGLFIVLSQGYEEFRVECSAYKAPRFPSAERRDDRSEFKATSISIQGKYDPSIVLRTQLFQRRGKTSRGSINRQGNQQMFCTPSALCLSINKLMSSRNVSRQRACKAAHDRPSHNFLRAHESNFEFQRALFSLPHSSRFQALFQTKRSSQIMLLIILPDFGVSNNVI